MSLAKEKGIGPKKIVRFNLQQNTIREFDAEQPIAPEATARLSRGAPARGRPSQAAALAASRAAAAIEDPSLSK